MENTWIVWAVGVSTVLASLPVGSLCFGWLYRKRREVKLQNLTRGKLVLTYDDGPSVFANGTMGLVAMLTELRVRATFYLIGWRAEQNPGICNTLRDAQQELANHTTWHLDAWRCVRVWRLLQDIRTGYAELGPWISPDAAFRPPRGRLTLLTWWALKRRGARIDFWTHDSRDSHPTLADPRDVLEQVSRSGGGVVLMHCHHWRPERIDYVLDLTRLLVQLAWDRGWEICTMFELTEGPRRQSAEKLVRQSTR